MKASEIIEKLKLIPMPDEGGYYRETYRSDLPKVAANSFGIESDLDRSVCTAIFYFVVPESFSALHKVRSDEIFHFYSGDAVEMLQIDESGKELNYIIGNKIENGEVPQVVVPRGVWQGLRLKEGGQWALMGTTVAPGFEFEDFELGYREKLIKQFPHLSASITRFTRERNEKAH